MQPSWYIRPMTPTPLPLKLLTTGRFIVAASHLLTPRAVASSFRSPESLGTPAIAFMRLFGIRNAALGVGLLQRRSLPAPRTFMKLNVLVDTVDALAFADAGRRGDMNPTAAVLSTGVALSAVAAGSLALLSTADDGVRI
jgi:hypothetical protein